MKPLIVVSLIVVGMNAFAMTSSAPQNDIQTYTIQDGYGKYVGQGNTKIEAESDAREKCAQSQFVAYEDRHAGTTPDADTADLMIDACINK